MSKSIRRVLSIVVLLVVTATWLHATSVQFPYQARLTDAAGEALSGSYTIQFSLYDVSAGGTALWTETHAGVVVDDGFLTVLLGSMVSIDPSLFDGSPRYLGVKIGSDPELSPRTPLAASPYAARAATVDGFAPGSSNVITGLNGFAAGDSNTVLTDYSSIAGGYGNFVELTNIADSTFDTVGIFDSKEIGHFDVQGFASDVMIFPCVYPPWWTPLFVGGGFGNTAIGNGSGVGWGGNNTAGGGFSAIAGGGANYAEMPFSFIGGGYCNQTLAPGRYQAIGGGIHNYAAGQMTTIGGGAYNGAMLGYTGRTIGGGFANRANNHVSTIGGGRGNGADGFAATIGGGEFNLALANYATIGGGRSDSATAQYATVAGGFGNHALGIQSAIGGGSRNRAEGQSSTIGGGEGNQALLHPYQFIGGGLNNQATDPLATIGGGQENVASTWATVGGGVNNQSVNEYTFIGGGLSNVANAYAAVVGGGSQNFSTNYATFVGGGQNNNALGVVATIGGGLGNVAQADTTFIGGGTENSAGSAGATIGGGRLNVVSARMASILGGEFNGAFSAGGVVGGGRYNRVGPGDHATVPGGFMNAAMEPYTFAAGTGATADDSCSFVWSDCCFDPATGVSLPFHSILPRSFNVRATNGFYFLTGCDSVAAPGSGLPGVFISPGGSMWSSLSSRTMKKNIEEVDSRQVLDKVASLPIYFWSYNSQEDGIRHIGPMAEDFHAAFGLGDNNKTISTLDPSGVALAAVKELNKKVEEIESLKSELKTVSAELAELKAQVAQLLAAQQKSGDGDGALASAK